jgi:hypothetical protein
VDENVRGTALRAESDASGQIRWEIGEAERNQLRSNPAQSARFAASEKLMGSDPVQSIPYLRRCKKIFTGRRAPPGE